MKNIRILEKTKGEPSFFEEDFDDNNPLITGEYEGWYEQHKMYNHKWSEWRTEEHMICAIKINGKWYGKCWDDEI